MAGMSQDVRISRILQSVKSAGEHARLGDLAAANKSMLMARVNLEEARHYTRREAEALEEAIFVLHERVVLILHARQSEPELSLLLIHAITILKDDALGSDE